MTDGGASKILHLVTDPSKISVGVSAYVRHYPHTSVPCGSCTACCRSAFDLTLNAKDDPSQYETEIGRMTGLPSLKKTADGACVYLKNDGCSIHDRRPITCQKFDCRVEVLAVLRTSAIYNKAAWEKFDFSYRDPQDRSLRRAVNMLFQALRDATNLTHENDGNMDHSLIHAAILLLRRNLKRVRGDVEAAYLNAVCDIGRELTKRLSELRGVSDADRRTTLASVDDDGA